MGNNGEARLRYFKQVVDAPSLSKTGWAYDWGGLQKGDTWLAFITFLVGKTCLGWTWSKDLDRMLGIPSSCTHAAARAVWLLLLTRLS